VPDQLKNQCLRQRVSIHGGPLVEAGFHAGLQIVAATQDRQAGGFH